MLFDSSPLAKAWTSPALEPEWAGLAAAPLTASGDADFAHEDIAYAEMRARAEAEMAERATHPAARHAHLEMAALYQHRVRAALQADDPAVQDWMSEGGNWLLDA